MAESILLHNNNKLGCSDLDMAFISDLRRYVLQEGAVKAYRLPVLEQEADMDNSIFLPPTWRALCQPDIVLQNLRYVPYKTLRINTDKTIFGSQRCFNLPQPKTYTDKMSYRNTQHEFMRKICCASGHRHSMIQELKVSCSFANMRRRKPMRCYKRIIGRLENGEVIYSSVTVKILCSCLWQFRFRKNNLSGAADPSIGFGKDSCFSL